MGSERSRAIEWEKYYQTQPPQQLGKIKVGSVLEYLVFSGTSVYFDVDDPKKSARLTTPGIPIDVDDDKFIVEFDDPQLPIGSGDEVQVNFGYKRKRATFTTRVHSKRDKSFYLEIPASISLTNLRRNPRIRVDDSLYEQDVQTVIRAKTSVGDVEIKRAKIFEFSQLGMSLFVSRDEALLLPGDRIESLEVQINNSSVLNSRAIVSRVDMGRQNPSIENSYQIVILFRQNNEQKLTTVKRGAKRTPVLDNKPCFFSAEHPFFPGRRLEGQVFEISSSGLSCMLEKTSFPVIPGMRFQDCRLQLPYSPSREIVFEVVHSDYRSDGESNQFKLGGEFVNAPVELLKDISEYESQALNQLTQDLTEEDLDLLWEFMFETNFIYQKKRKQIQQKSREIIQTYHRLLSKDNPIVKKIIFKEDGEIKGHLSGIRFYDHSWLTQHLNATKTSGESAAQAVFMKFTDFLGDSQAHAKNSIFYNMSFYRPNNIYPAILFGESVRRLNDPEKAVTYDFAFGLYSPKAGGDEPDPGKAVLTQDTDEVVNGIVDHLIRKDMTNFLRAVGLASKAPLQLNVSKEYEKLGLVRSRHVLKASMDNHFAYALVERSSAGLNLSELTNSVYIFTDTLDELAAQELTDILVKEAYERFFEEDEILPTVLAPYGSQAGRSVLWSKVYSCMVLSEHAMWEFQKNSEGIFRDMRQLIRDYRNDIQFSKFELKSPAEGSSEPTRP